MTQRFSMMGCLMDNLSMEETVARVAAFVQSGTPRQHVVLNLDKLVKASRDPGRPHHQRLRAEQVVCGVKRIYEQYHRRQGLLRRPRAWRGWRAGVASLAQCSL